jgi:hypothetical protein
MTTNNTTQDLSDEELAKLSDDELIERIDKSIEDLKEVNDEVEKNNNELEAGITEDKAGQDVLDENEDKEFMEEVEGELDLGLNNAILDLATDDDGEVE